MMNGKVEIHLRSKVLRGWAIVGDDKPTFRILSVISDKFQVRFIAKYE